MILFIYLKIILLHFFFLVFKNNRYPNRLEKEKKKTSLCFFYESRALFIGLANTDFNKFFFKTGSHDTIHTFKNYFSSTFLVFNFQQ